MSAIPEAIDQIVALIGTVVAKVFDGPPEGVWPDEDCVVVGWTREGPGVTVETEPAGFGSPNQEQFSIACVISVVGGDLTLQALRNRAFGHYNAISTKIRQDKTLSGTVSHARPSSAAVTQFLNQESGGAVEVAFAIACTAYI